MVRTTVRLTPHVQKLKSLLLGDISQCKPAIQVSLQQLYYTFVFQIKILLKKWIEQQEKN
mgnify:CR=1 FL=1